MSGNPVSRSGDLTCGHPWYPTPPSSFSANVFANGKGIIRNGDSIVTHCFPDKGCHGGSYTGGSSVYVNGSAAQRVGHSVSCGDSLCIGSPNVYVP